MAEQGSVPTDKQSFSNLERFTYFKKEDFELDWDKVSSSSFSHVYKVKLRLWRERCAVKSFHDSREYRNMLQVTKRGNVKFKYLISIYGLRKDPPASVMEFMNKGSLEDLLTSHVLMWPKKFQMIHEVTMGMNFLHSIKPPLLHLNLKLSNILLDDHLHVKVSDFGQIKWEDYSNKTAFIEHLAARGNINYIAPETLTQNPEPLTSKYDVYSFAIVVWEILTQTRPYTGMNMTEILIRVSSGKRPSVETIADDRPHECEEMIGMMQQCWDQDWSERPTFAETVLLTEALSDVLKVPDLLPGSAIKRRSSKIESALFSFLRRDSKEIPEVGSADNYIYLYLKHKNFESFKKVLKKDHISLTFKDGSSVLHHAAASGDAGCVRMVLNHGAPVNCQSNSGYTPLIIALLKKSYDICGLLVEHGADVNLGDQDLWMPLHFAAQAGDDRGVRLLLDAKAAADPKDKDGWTPLHLAAQNGHENVVRHLLPRLSEVNEREVQAGSTPLHTASMYGHLKIASLLLSKGADPHTTDNAQATALHLAAEGGHFRVTRLLLLHGADVNRKDQRSYTALHFAALRGCTGICRILLSHGADANVRTLQNWTPLHLAALKGHAETVLILEENGSLVDTQGKGGWTALHLACHHQFEEVVSVLMSAGANPNVVEDEGWTPLHLACHKGSFTSVLRLIAGHANVNAENGCKDTPLHLAVQSKNVPIVKALLMNHAATDRVDSKGLTALDLAPQGQMEEMVQLLKR
ncbi:ankyrin repeat and protein kinase domain-containing protein 1 [Trichomycterus rosablanca]|uniref:ankyrin repeat and protein kinase domain-containing protein 1 n=1 Tax=Trichomycterus rosablanca TaxID=2290929 RepID=UPI002F352F1B